MAVGHRERNTNSNRSRVLRTPPPCPFLRKQVGDEIPMAEPQRWQVSTDAAEVYESCFVPAIFGAWAGRVADAAGLTTGNRSRRWLRDGRPRTRGAQTSGARRSGRRPGYSNQGMLAVATRAEPKIEWRQGDAASLPLQGRELRRRHQPIRPDVFCRPCCRPEPRCGALSRRPGALR